MSRVVRIELRDALAFPASGVVSPAPYVCVVFARVPESWLDGDTLPADRVETFLGQMYGKAWRNGNDDGSQYVVLDLRLAVLASHEERQRPWLGADSADGIHKFWFWRVAADGRIEGVKPAELGEGDSAGTETYPRSLSWHELASAPPAFVPTFEPPAATLVRPHALEGHKKFVQALVFTPDGTLVSGSEDGTLRVWDVVTRRCVAVKSDHRSAVNCLSLTPDGMLLSGSDDATVKVWALPRFEVVRTLEGHRGFVSEVHPAGRGRVVSSSEDGTLRLWDLSTGACLKEMAHGEWPHSMHVSPDGRRAVACSAYYNVMKVWNLESGESERVLVDAGGQLNVLGERVPAENTTGIGHRKPAKHILFAPDGGTFLSSSEELILWDATSGSERFRIASDGWPIGGFAFVPGTPRVFAAGHETVRLFDLDAGAVVAEAPWAHGNLRNVAVSPDGHWGASGSEDGAVGLWDLAALAAAGRPERHLGRPRALAVSDDGRRALTSGADRTARLWDLERGTNIAFRYEEGLFVEPVALTPDGRRALVMTEQGVLRAYDTETGEARGEARSELRYTKFIQHRFLSGDRLLVGSVGGPLAIWPLDPLGPGEPFDGDGGHVVALAVDETTDLVVSSEFGSGDFQLRIKFWSLSGRRLTREVQLDLYAYGTDVLLLGDCVVVPTSTGSVVVLDREGRRRHSVAVADNGIPNATALANGRVGLGGATPMVFDPVSGTVDVIITLQPKQSARAIRGEPRALVEDPNAGLALLDYEALSLSPFTPLPEPWLIEMSGNRNWVVAASSREDLVGAPLVLRRTISG